jgi:hypothetical protein
MSSPSWSGVLNPAGLTMVPLMNIVGVEFTPRPTPCSVEARTSARTAGSATHASQSVTSTPAASAIDLTRSGRKPPAFSPSWLA